ncbi:MAG: hypothetical protein JXR70_09755 [Spirochaetales bacterium]|nr:hypothetical protein [Spirochaetales bacterium]
MKQKIKIKYLKEYLAAFLWKLEDIKDMYPEIDSYSHILFESELENSLRAMSKAMSLDSRLQDVKDALRYILNQNDFPVHQFVQEAIYIQMPDQNEARDLLIKIWDFLYTESWEYQLGEVSDCEYVVTEKLENTKRILDLITHRIWHDNKDNYAWDTQIHFKPDHSGFLLYGQKDEPIKMKLGFTWMLKAYANSDDAFLFITVDDFALSFELAIKAIRSIKTAGWSDHTDNIVLKFSDHPYHLTRDVINQRSHAPEEVIFYQLIDDRAS